MNSTSQNLASRSSEQDANIGTLQGEIKLIDKTNEAILPLQPVTF